MDSRKKASQTAHVFGLGIWEIGAILVVALLVFGPSKLPELARNLGRGLREFRKATDDFRSTLDAEMSAPDRPQQLPSSTVQQTNPDSVTSPDGTISRSSTSESPAAQTTQGESPSKTDSTDEQKQKQESADANVAKPTNISTASRVLSLKTNFRFPA